jgi:hypothetical protein
MATQAPAGLCDLCDWSLQRCNRRIRGKRFENVLHFGVVSSFPALAGARAASTSRKINRRHSYTGCSCVANVLLFLIYLARVVLDLHRSPPRSVNRGCGHAARVSSEFARRG